MLEFARVGSDGVWHHSGVHVFAQAVSDHVDAHATILVASLVDAHVVHVHYAPDVMLAALALVVCLKILFTLNSILDQGLLTSIHAADANSTLQVLSYSISNASKHPHVVSSSTIPAHNSSDAEIIFML